MHGIKLYIQYSGEYIWQASIDYLAFRAHAIGSIFNLNSVMYSIIFNTQNTISLMNNLLLLRRIVQIWILK